MALPRRIKKKRQPPVKHKPGPRKKPIRITAELAEKMFQVYSKGNSQAYIAKKFKADVSTVSRLVRKHGWKDRLEGIQQHVRALTDQQIVTGITKNIEDAEKILDRMGTMLLNQDIPIEAMTAQPVSDFCRLSRLVVDLRGIQSPDASRSNLISRVMSEIEATDPENRRTMAESILAGFNHASTGGAARITEIWDSILPAPDQHREPS